MITTRLPPKSRVIFLCSLAQTSLEYAALISCFVAAILLMSTYISRSMRGYYKKIGDDIGQHYVPTNTSGNSTLSYDSRTRVITDTVTQDETVLGVDLNGDGDATDTNVVGTRVRTQSLNETTHYHGDETIGGF